jgi:hypothetical protein
VSGARSFLLDHSGDPPPVWRVSVCGGPCFWRSYPVISNARVTRYYKNYGMVAQRGRPLVEFNRWCRPEDGGMAPVKRVLMWTDMLLTGAAGGTIATLVTAPFDAIKVNQSRPLSS